MQEQKSVKELFFKEYASGNICKDSQIRDFAEQHKGSNPWRWAAEYRLRDTECQKDGEFCIHIQLCGDMYPCTVCSRNPYSTKKDMYTT